ncbi:MAG: hypothetical protein IJ816_00065 [Alloprevotella sp.]|nr:hypothetical protein [Alloprevotella sp.]
MKKEDLAELTALELAVKQLLRYMQVLKDENARLKQECELYQAQVSSLRSEKEMLQETYNRLKLVKILDVSNTDLKDARQRVDSLIRKVDRCIALINA